jgi:hypothetical protein
MLLGAVSLLVGCSDSDAETSRTQSDEPAGFDKDSGLAAILDYFDASLGALQPTASGLDLDAGGPTQGVIEPSSPTIESPTGEALGTDDTGGDVTNGTTLFADASTAASSAASGDDSTSALDASLTQPGMPVEASLPESDAAVSPLALLDRLAFWFDPTSLVPTGERVAEWTDLSGHDHDALQSEPSEAPAYGASGIGGLPSVSFDGSPQFFRIADDAGLRWGTDDFVILAVVRANEETGLNAMIYQKTGDVPFDGPSLFLNSSKPTTSTRAVAQVSGEVYVLSGGEPETFVDDTAHVLATRRVGKRLEIRVDGRVSAYLESAAVADTNVDAPGQDGIVGANGYNPTPEFQQVRGELSELIAVHGACSDAEVTGLESYLAARYAL